MNSVLIIGQSGSGKSTSIRNLDESTTAIFQVVPKHLPFRNKYKKNENLFQMDNSDKIARGIKLLVSQGYKTFIVDDMNYIMTNSFMKRSAELGFQKFTDMAREYWSMINAIQNIDSDAVCYFMSHVDTDQNGMTQVKTLGKLINEKVCVEGMFSIVLMTEATDKEYSFVTQTNGMTPCKSPIDMFEELKIPNDLNDVNETIKEYYSI